MLPKKYVIISIQLQEEFFELAYALTSDLSGFLGAEEGFDLIKFTFDPALFSETELSVFISELSGQTGKQIIVEKSFVGRTSKQNQARSQKPSCCPAIRCALNPLLTSTSMKSFSLIRFEICSALPGIIRANESP